jgi:hypothetical protein
MAKPETPPSASFVRSILDYDLQTGIFRWRYRADRSTRWNTRYAGKIAGSLTSFGYIVIQLGKGAHYKAQVLAWLYVYGEWRQIDHRNGIRNENQIDNLRPATNSENGVNKRMQSNNASGFPGVHFDSQRRKWRACVNRDRTRYDGGFFSTPEEAAEARAKLAAKIQGEFAPTDPHRKRYRHHRDAP